MRRRSADARGPSQTAGWGTIQRLWRVAIGVAFALAVVGAPAVGRAQPADQAEVVADPAPDDQGEYEDTDPAALTDFRGTLDPHGRWVDHPEYGTVWVPSVVVVGKDFVPYKSAGRWAVTEAGDWVWVSDYEWGHVVFHYGRWVWIDDFGWAWIPGRRYAPSWVVWRVGEPGWDYVGWAPMGPSYIWVDGVAVTYAGSVILPFWFVPTVWFFHPYWYHHVVYDPYRVHLIAGHTHIYHHHYRPRGYARYGRRGYRPSHRRARPSVGDSAGGHEPASASAGTPRSGSKPLGGQRVIRPQPTSPSFGDARIPRQAQPTARVKVDRRAVAMAAPPASARRPQIRAHGPASSLRNASRSRASASGVSRPPASVRSRASSPSGRPSLSRRGSKVGSFTYNRGRSRRAIPFRGTSRNSTRRAAPSRSSWSTRAPSRARPTRGWHSRPSAPSPSRSAPSYGASSRWSPSRSAVPSSRRGSSRKSTKKSSRSRSSVRGKSRGRGGARGAIRSRSSGRRR